ncbi:MAG: hypothetical protein OD811_03010 [Alphaproteobacteria bacterium]
MNDTNISKINLRPLLKFFDEAPEESRGHATSVDAICGEDLALSLLKDYCERNGYTFSLLAKKCTPGTKKGSRLDAWVEINFENEICQFQTEIKNWSAHATDGKRLSINASSEEVRQHRIDRFRREFGFDGKNYFPLKKPQVSKVLTPMRKDFYKDGVKVAPLACFWHAMHHDGENEAYFKVDVDVNDAQFSELHIFSMSNHVRNLVKSGIDEINVESYDKESFDTKRRIGWLKEIFSVY